MYIGAALYQICARVTNCTAFNVSNKTEPVTSYNIQTGNRLHHVYGIKTMPILTQNIVYQNHQETEFYKNSLLYHIWLCILLTLMYLNWTKDAYWHDAFPQNVHQHPSDWSPDMCSSRR